MLLNRIFHSRIIWIVVVIGVVFAVAAGVLTNFKPQIAVSVSGDHSPVENSVYLNGQRLFPSGAGGINYKGKLRMGKNTVEMRGPFVKSESAEIQAGLVGGTQKVELSSSALNAESILKETINDSGAVYRDTKAFQDSNAIVGYKGVANVRDANEENSYPVIIFYNREKGEWEDITEKLTTNIMINDLYDLSDDVISYLYRLGSE